MHIELEYQGKSLTFEVDPQQLVTSWPEPRGQKHPASENEPTATSLRKTLAEPLDFPPIHQAVVPGDRVVVPVDPNLDNPAALLATLAETLRPCEIAEIIAISTAPAPNDLPAEVTWQTHDPSDRTQLAYLSSTNDGQRVYLNKSVTDADIVIPIGAIRNHPLLGYLGPASVIYPGLSDLETIANIQKMSLSALAEQPSSHPLTAQTTEVSWLLGCQLQVGVLTDSSGQVEIRAGLETSLTNWASSVLDAEWTVRAEETADLVVVGLTTCANDDPTLEIAIALLNARKLVRRGGKVALVTSSAIEQGPAMKRLLRAETPRAALARLKGHEADPDYLAARIIAETLDWADVYAFSSTDSDFLDDLGIIPIENPNEVVKLARLAHSVSFVSHANLVRVAAPTSN